MKAKFNSHFEASGANVHTLEFPTEMGEDRAKADIIEQDSTADENMWDYMHELRRQTNAGNTLIEYELRVSANEESLKPD
ncbi:hypothetical protein BH11ARM1_BH11ARM1_05900 [soil metagenome]